MGKIPEGGPCSFLAEIRFLFLAKYNFLYCEIVFAMNFKIPRVCGAGEFPHLGLVIYLALVFARKFGH
jgi:hypothetical protein